LAYAESVNTNFISQSHPSFVTIRNTMTSTAPTTPDAPNNAILLDDINKNMTVDEIGVPIIDMSQPDKSKLILQIANACSTWGFFQLTSHGIPDELLQSFQTQMKVFFDLPIDIKKKLKRNECNARGFFDDELTKRRRDWKEALDCGVPGSRDWSCADDDDVNACLDGLNQFPSVEDAPYFRSVVVEYFEACAELSDRIAILMAQGLGVDTENSASSDDDLLQNLRKQHTSYLRMNYYPPCPLGKEDEKKEEDNPPPLGISPHRDAGFLTVLLQDDDCHSLQVEDRNSHENQNETKWVTVKPVPGALTINTGDMAMIWSNGKYQAPLHRVLTDASKKRYSAPFFYNPGYSAHISPLPHLTSDKKDVGQHMSCVYHPCVWGYFRAVRFAGDLTDLGVEIQTSDFLVHPKNDNDEDVTKKMKSNHLEKQAAFVKEADFQKPFSVERYRPLLEDTV